MNSVDDVMQVISIGLIVAVFLLNASRYLKAIELCKECLFILKDREGSKDEKLSKSLYTRIYLLIWNTCNLICDNAAAIKYAEKLLLIYRESGKTLEEYKLSLKLGEMYFHQGKNKQAKQLTEKTLVISKEIGHRTGEAYCYGKLGIMYSSVGECEKGTKHLEKALAIYKEIGDRNAEVTCYINLGLGLLANMRRLENFSSSHLRSLKKLETEEKRPVTKTLEPCISQLENMRRLKNFTRSHLRSIKKLEIEMEKRPVTKTLEPCISQLENMRKLKNFSRSHLRSSKKLETEMEERPVT